MALLALAIAIRTPDVHIKAILTAGTAITILGAVAYLIPAIGILGFFPAQVANGRFRVWHAFPGRDVETFNGDALYLAVAGIDDRAVTIAFLCA